MNTGLLILACVQALLLVAVVVILLRHFAQREEEWRDERRELLTRINRPELVPIKRDAQPTVPAPPRGNGHQVGHVFEPLADGKSKEE